ncbi:pyridoxal phosphate-dependent aminotransferase [Lutibaculum baratangense]|nr:aminotransferase class I/II-fold pyridoxal phosphate-dependent enzyme [Lutibaculum baratangense]
MSTGAARVSPGRGPSRRSDVAPFIAMDVLAEAARLEAQGRDIVHLEVGQPGFPAPLAAREAAIEAARQGRVGYTEALGLPRLRARIARHYADWYGLDVPAERIAVTTGSSAGFVLTFLAALDGGARVALPQPGYPAYRGILHGLGIEPVAMVTSEEQRWTPTPEDLQAAFRTGRLDGFLVASPNNPTGTVVEPGTLRDLVAMCRDENALFVSDEIYHGLTFDRPAQTALSFSDEVVVVNSFSKYFCMTGWRIGWLVLPEWLVRPVERLAQSLFISPPALSQHAALAVMDCGSELEANKAVYGRNREILTKRLPQMGLPRFAPMDGAFYAYVDISAHSHDSFDFTQRMLREIGVAATPGLDFDPDLGGRFMRLSIAGSSADVEEAMDRVSRWLER